MPASNRMLRRAEKDVRGSAIRIGVILLIAPLYDWAAYADKGLAYGPVAYLVPRACVVTLLAMVLGALAERIFHTGLPRWVRGVVFVLTLVAVWTFSRIGLTLVDLLLMGQPMRGLGVLTVVGFMLGCGLKGAKSKRDAISNDICHPSGVVG